MWVLHSMVHLWNEEILRVWHLSYEYGLESTEFLRYVKYWTETWKLPMRVSQKGKNWGNLELTGSSWNNTPRPLSLAARELLLGYRAEITLNASPLQDIFITVNMKAFNTRGSNFNEPLLHKQAAPSLLTTRLPLRELIKRHTVSPCCLSTRLGKHGQRPKWCQMAWSPLAHCPQEQNWPWKHIHLPSVRYTAVNIMTSP